MSQLAFLAFEGDGLDRRAELRDDATALKESWDSANVLLVWRGKPLMGAALDEHRPLAFVEGSHPMVKDQFDSAVFLGEAQSQFYFAIDLSNWEPTEENSTENSFVDKSEQQHSGLPEGQVFTDLRANMPLFTPRDAEIAATAKSILGWQSSHRFCARCGQESRVAQAGWRRDCPACGGQHFPRTDPVVIMLVTHGNSVLLGRSPDWPERMYSLLAGFVEPGETMETAVKREVFEETGVDVKNVRYEASQPWPFVSSLMIGCAAEAVSTDLKIDPNEIEDALWLSREEVLDVFADRHPLVRPVRRGPIAGFLLQNWLADQLTSRE
ncbi:NAD(+) diphosphatase [Actibacterium pelagium]|uniref:NAD(+) diphosphatase n=1 Tax=Actibacterium pelagium TaxID=2029103 RepID=A0A917AFZ7_9RHOB|nr:NAD(+) diphosphatase [Actibacterium pelagium]GGE50335.1 NADH pyrophosphatase [Actibacterium pelagium]